MNPILTFDESAGLKIIEFLGKKVNEEGFIVEKNNPDQKILDFNGEEVHIKEFGGMQKGSEIFIKNDVVSLIRFCKKK